MWFLKSEFIKQFKDCRIVYLTWLGRKFDSSTQNFNRLLEILEVDIDKLQPIEEPTQFEKIILPDESFPVDSGLRKFTNEYRETIERVRAFAMKNRTPTSSTRVYYFHGARQVGEERLAEYFKSKGYEIVRPEKLTLDEQLNLLINTKSFATTLGSCSHNSLFLRDGTEAIFIPREGIFSRDYQFPIDHVHPLNVTYIDSTLSIFDKGNRYRCHILSEQLKRFFGDKWDGYEEDDFKIFLEYVKTSMSRNFDMDSREKIYYAPVLENFMTKLKRREDLIAACDMPKGWETFQPPLPDGLTYQTHISNKGWGTWSGAEGISGFPEQQLQMEAVKVNFPDHKIYYAVYYGEAEGWSEEVSNGEQAGTTGKVKPIHGIRIRLDEAGSNEFDVLYRLHTFEGAWTPWKRNGEEIITQGVKLNALQIKLEPK